MFPQKTKWLKRPIGWEDLGRCLGYSDFIEGSIKWLTPICSISNDVLHVGKEKGKLFRFCPRCLGKVK